MLAVASNLFGKASSLSAYNLHSTAPSPASSSTHLPSTAGASKAAPSINVGLWKVVGATHKTTAKDVSVWTFEKRVLDSIRGDGSGRTAAQARDWVLEQLKKEATSLSRLRHPDILHMVEPLEETRSELTFVTEVITSSLGTLISAAKTSRRADGVSRPPGDDRSSDIDLDEVEIQKGTLQIARGLTFLHQQAKMVHLNLSPDAILINAKGDWKLSALSLTTPLSQPDGSATKYVYPETDPRLPPQIQWKLDYLAPEYGLDSTLTPASDLYSLGCVLFAVHMGGKPPFQNRSSMSTFRDNMEGPLLRRTWEGTSSWNKCSAELRDLLPRLLTRHPSTRLSLASLPSHPFFSSLAINTLNFLDPTAFASKPREEKATFLRGLVRVLPTFSDRLRRNKILPSLLEEMKDPYLLPFLLPNVFEIAKSLKQEDFSPVLTKLQPLFALRDPPQNMMTLLEHLSLFEEKTTPPLFREHVMPLIYNSLECDHMPVQEKALKLVPHLCEILDYGTVQNILLVNVAILFTRTRVLSIKVQTLECFKAMVKTLDKTTLTTKLVPMLAKIKTKEPSVMMSTLAVHEAMGAKVDREAIATLVLPQLWAMSMGPLLNADQFGRFMSVIKSLGQRVEQEHSEHLRDVRRIEQQAQSFDATLSSANGSSSLNGNASGEVDFESLVKGGSGSVVASSSIDPWDAGWADTTDTSLANSSFDALTLSPPSITSSPFPPSLTSSPFSASTSRLPSSSSILSPTLRQNPLSSTPNTYNPPALPAPPAFQSRPSSSLQPATSSFATLQPAIRPAHSAFSASSMGAPNYSLSLSPQDPALQPQIRMQPPVQSTSINPVSRTASLQPASRPPPGWQSGLMQPTIAPQPTWNTGANGKTDWGDFDPLK